MPNSSLHRIVSRLTGVSARHRRVVLIGWVLFVVACVFAGGTVGTRSLTDAQSGNGSSARGLQTLLNAHLTEPATESVLIRGENSSAVLRAAESLRTRVRTLPNVTALRAPAGHPALLAHGGRDALIELTLRGTPQDSVVGVQRAVSAIARANPSLRLFEVGDGSIARAANASTGSDFHRAELFAVPLTLVILVLAFGALVAACVPLLLGLTSVAAAIGAVGALSHLVPTSSTTSSAVLLIGLAVGVDYSLFYMRREREERLAGRAPLAALEATSATVGHAVVVSGMSVIVAMAGLLLTGSSVFTSIALGTMLVVAISVIGSVTVLPAVLAMLGDRIDRGHMRRRRAHTAGRPSKVWGAVASSVVARPRIALVSVVLLLAPLAFAVLQLHTSEAIATSVPPGSRVLTAQREIDRAFPGGSLTAQIVVSGDHLNFSAPSARARLHTLGDQAVRQTRTAGIPAVKISRNTHVAEVEVPLPGSGTNPRSIDALNLLRGRVLSEARAAFPGARTDLTGAAASEDDFNSQMRDSAPIVIGFVLTLGFGLLWLAFGSLALAASILALNLLSVGAAFGALVLIFQHSWAQGLLGFVSDGTIVTWLPLFAFAVLFGLSMDYTVLVVSRVLEGTRRGLPTRQAVAEGVAATAGAVSSAALVMVAVFAVFATLRALEFKELGIGLALAILIDATLVRGVALPAAITLLTDRSRARGRRSAAQPHALTDIASSEVS
jgi:RND superfamily putative drug exporter